MTSRSTFPSPCAQGRAPSAWRQELRVAGGEGATRSLELRAMSHRSAGTSARLIHQPAQSLRGQWPEVKPVHDAVRADHDGRRIGAGDTKGGLDRTNTRLIGVRIPANRIGEPTGRDQVASI